MKRTTNKSMANGKSGLATRRADLKRLRELFDKGFVNLTDAEREEQSDLLDRVPLPRSWFKKPPPEDLARINRKLGRSA
jgi:hypothetical protein